MTKQSKAGVSRRKFFAGVVGSAGAALVPAAGAAEPTVRELHGKVAWCNRGRGFLKFHPERATDPECLIQYRVPDEDALNLRDLFRPGARLALRIAQPAEPFSAWRLHAIVHETTGEVPVEAHLQSLTWHVRNNESAPPGR